MVTFTINIPQMLAYTPYMDPMGHGFYPEIGDSSGRPAGSAKWVDPSALEQFSFAGCG